MKGRNGQLPAVHVYSQRAARGAVFCDIVFTVRMHGRLWRKTAIQCAQAHRSDGIRIECSGWLRNRLVGWRMVGLMVTDTNLIPFL